jgi:hypothetical protein
MARRPNLSNRPSRRRLPVRTLRVVAVLVAPMLAGGAMLVRAGLSPAGTTDPLANTVRSTAGAPVVVSRHDRPLNAPFVDVASTPNGRGYWAVSADGGVFTYGDAGFFGSATSMHLGAPIVGIAPTKSGNGYWLAAADGGVFAFGDAGFHGSAYHYGLAAPIVNITSTRTGDGYWLAAADGGVFSFGDAGFYGSATPLKVSSPVMALAATASNGGYYLVTADGGVLTFGDARFRGAAIDSSYIATDIATAANGRGYAVLRNDGSVVGFGTASVAAPRDAKADSHPAIAFTYRRGGGIWEALGYSPPPSTPDVSQDPFLKCTRAHESDTSGGYHAVSPGGTYRGAYQFVQSTWDNVARAAGRPDLVGVDPAQAAPADQDQLALFLYHQQGAGPWGGRCAGLP